MPRRNATGPTGAGPMTGRGMGPCTTSPEPGPAGVVNRRSPANFSQVRGQDNSLPAGRGRKRGSGEKMGLEEEKNRN